jgi:hypothetical protein
MKNIISSSDRLNRRQFLRIGGSSLCGVSLLDLLRSQSQTAGPTRGKAKALICIWMSGGPPHTDMFDMKPDSPVDYRGEFKPIRTTAPGLEICELMPKLARIADKYTVLRSVTTDNKNGGHLLGPMYWLTGNPRRDRGTPLYPLYGSVVTKLRPGPEDLPTFAVFDKVDAVRGNSFAPSYLGPAYNPFVFDPTRSSDDTAKMLTPQMELPVFARNADLLKAVDNRLRRQDALDPLVAGLDRYQQTAFNLLRSPKLREALDLSKEPSKTLERYGGARNAYYGGPKHVLLARRLVEAGVPVVHCQFNHWDFHDQNFKACRQALPLLDTALSALVEDLDYRGLLDSTIVLALGEMGRTPKIDNTSGRVGGRDHWDYAQFVLAAGGGFRRGAVVGATDKKGERVANKLYKVESFGSTLYHLLGIAPDTVLTAQDMRPMKLIAEEAPLIKEAIL